MGLLNYVKPTQMRLILWVALFILANIPYIGTVVAGETKCVQANCNSIDTCTGIKQCYENFQARPSWVFWWPYPEFSINYSEIQFSTEAIPITTILNNPTTLLDVQALLATFAYWYLICLIITFAGANDNTKWYNQEVETEV